MGEWVGGWMGGVDKWVDGWVGRWTGGQVDRVVVGGGWESKAAPIPRH